jgi:hypothetical protein
METKEMFMSVQVIKPGQKFYISQDVGILLLEASSQNL